MMTTIAEAPAAAIRRRLTTALLTRGNVVLIGLGGIGLFLGRAVMIFLGGLLQARTDGEAIRVLLVDGDAFEPGNTYRMDVPDFGNKAVMLAEEFLRRFDLPGLTVRPIPEYVTEQNVARLIHDGDCVLLACDNHATRRLVSRRCAADDIRDIVLISGGNDGLDDESRGTGANVQVFFRQDGRNVTAPLELFHPEIATPVDRSPAELSCLEAAAAGAGQIVFANFAAASAMCSALLRLLMPPGGENPYDEVSLDILDARSLPHWLST